MSQAESTEILKTSRSGDPTATSRLLSLVYDELRRIAAHYVRRGGRQQTLQATEIVHEAYLKLVGQENVEWQDRTHFISVAACAMRQVLIAHARKRSAKKRGGDRLRFPLRDSLAVSGGPDVDLLSLDEALLKLNKLHERQVRIVELRFFGGLTYEEIAATLKVSPKTVETDWYAARAWLHRELGKE